MKTSVKSLLKVTGIPVVVASLFCLTPVILALSLIWYFRREKGIYAIVEARKLRNEIINTVAIVFIAGVVGYVLRLYAIVEYAGKHLNIWS